MEHLEIHAGVSQVNSDIRSCCMPHGRPQAAFWEDNSSAADRLGPASYRLLGRQVRGQGTIIEPSEFRDPGIGKAFA